MICTRCFSRRTPAFARAFTTTPSRLSTPITAETSTTATPRSPSGAPAATSKPGVAQPFSTPLTPAAAPAPSAKASAPKVQSSVPAGTVLKGLNFYKDKQDPVAMADEEYPAWLWRVLDKTSADQAGVVVDEGDLYGMSKFLFFLSAESYCWGSVAGFPILPYSQNSVLEARCFF